MVGGGGGWERDIERQLRGGSSAGFRGWFLRERRGGVEREIDNLLGEGKSVYKRRVIGGFLFCLGGGGGERDGERGIRTLSFALKSNTYPCKQDFCMHHCENHGKPCSDDLAAFLHECRSMNIPALLSSWLITPHD